MNKFEERLLGEWKKHGKLIIAVDYDDTISPWSLKEEEDLHNQLNLIKLLLECKEVGAYIVVFTASAESRYGDIKAYCDSYGLSISGINHNAIDLPYGNNCKIYANIYLDDRAGLNEATDMLRNVLNQFKLYKN